MKGTKTVFMLALCVVTIVFSLYFQFMGGAGKEEICRQEEDEEKEEKPKIIQEPPELSVEEEELIPERFGLEDGWSIYFTGMEEIQEDDTFLPYQAYADLVPAAMDFLREQTEFELPGTDIKLVLSDGMTYRKNNLISFHCYFADFDTELELEFVYDDIAMEYIEIHFTEKGVWNLKWKN